MANRQELREQLDRALSENIPSALDPDSWGTTSEAQSGMMKLMSLADRQ